MQGRSPARLFEGLREPSLFPESDREVVPGNGLELFSRGTFDLVITDVRMPGTTGLQVMRMIRKMAPDVPVILITAFGGMETTVEATSPIPGPSAPRYSG